MPSPSPSRSKKLKAERRGRLGELAARCLLRAKGYRILAKNLRTRHGEIDILAARGRTLIAVEVKTRTSIERCHYAVSPQQCQRIERSLQAVLTQPKYAGLAAARASTIRFDVIWLAPRRWPVHTQDAWRIEY